MFKPKPIAIVASVGFVLSFIIGLICGVRVGFVFLRAFLFAILCGGVCFGVMFVYEKFLKTDSVSESVDLHSETQEAEGSESFEVSEDALPDEDSSPVFYVEPKNEAKNVNAMPTFKASSIEKLTSTKASAPEVEAKPEVKKSAPV